jgi:hypothetical protein
MRRSVWFVAGAGAGVYATTKVRRTLDVFTPGGLRDRLAGLTLAARLFGGEVRAGMASGETDLRRRLGLGLDRAAERHLPAAATGQHVQERREVTG